MKRLVAGLGICGMVCMGCAAGMGPNPPGPLVVFHQQGHPGDGRYLAHADGTPFFYLGDTAWELFHRQTREEADEYLDNRAAKGFTVIQAVALAEFDGLGIPNAYGDVPFIDADPLRPAVTPGADPADADEYDYWDHVDWIVDAAAQKGLYIGLLPTWGDKVDPRWGIGPAIFTPETARAYGAWIGARYRDAANIIWILGGDRQAAYEDSDFRPVWRAMAEGIRSVDTVHLISYHPMGGTSSSRWFHHDDWLDFFMMQSGHGQKNIPNYRGIEADYRLSPFKPCMDAEPPYEDHPVNWKPEQGWFDDADVRLAAYWAVFAGAHGHTYGCHDIWQFYQQGRTPVSSARTDWRTAIDLPGSYQVGHLRALMLSRPYFTRIPDQTLVVAGDGAGMAHVQATRAADGAYAFVYIPTGETVGINLSVLTAGNVTAWWFDPREGTAIPAGTWATATGSAMFDPPGEPGRGNDWVLVLDSAGRGFPAPGPATGRQKR